jgi:molybdate transport system substrate-binding protein
MKRSPALLLLVILIVAGCSPTAAPTSVPQTLTVFAAASLTEAFTEIGKSFEADNPNVTLVFNFAGSQALRTQIEEGAPADVFASANKTEMDKLIDASFIAQDAPQIFLNNKLVVILPVDNPAELNQLEDLAKPGIKLVLAAEEVPVGKYARQALDAMNGQYGTDFKDKVLANVVSNEDNVRQVVAKVQLGEADAGVVYTSDAIAASDLKTIEIPVEFNVIAEYPIAALTRSTNLQLANGFIDFVLSKEGQLILQKWGFASPG